MVKSGSQYKVFLHVATEVAEQINKNSKALSSAISSDCHCLCDKIRNEIKHKDFLGLLESQALCYDIQRTQRASDKALEGSEALFSHFAADFKDVMSHGGAVKYINKSNYGNPRSYLPSKDNNLNYIKQRNAELYRSIKELPDTQQSLKTYYMTVKDGLKVLGKEYEKNLNIALGKDISKEKDRGR